VEGIVLAVHCGRRYSAEVTLTQVCMIVLFHVNLLSELHFMYMSIVSYHSPLLPLPSLLSVPRVLKFLSCFDPEEPVMLGEAYGFYAHKPDGYSYVTGGGG